MLHSFLVCSVAAAQEVPPGKDKIPSSLIYNFACFSHTGQLCSLFSSRVIKRQITQYMGFTLGTDILYICSENLKLLPDQPACSICSATSQIPIREQCNKLGLKGVPFDSDNWFGHGILPIHSLQQRKELLYQS